MIASEEITSLDIENVLKSILKLDPGILIMIMGDLWRQWIEGKYLSVMTDLAIYFAKEGFKIMAFYSASDWLNFRKRRSDWAVLWCTFEMAYANMKGDMPL